MDIKDLQKGSIVLVPTCEGYCNGVKTFVPFQVANIGDLSDGVLITVLENPVTMVNISDLSGIRLTDFIIKLIGFSPIKGECPAYSRPFDNAYACNIGGKLFYIVKYGGGYHLAFEKSRPTTEVSFVHELQKEIGKFGKDLEISKNVFYDRQY